MDRMLACEAGDPGSIPGESTIERLPVMGVFLLCSRITKALLLRLESNGLTVYECSRACRQTGAQKISI